MFFCCLIIFLSQFNIQYRYLKKKKKKGFRAYCSKTFFFFFSQKHSLELSFIAILIALVLPPGDSDLMQQLSAVSLGDKLKMTVDVTREDGSVILTSDQLSHATVLASKYHVTGQPIKILHPASIHYILKYH